MLARLWLKLTAPKELTDLKELADLKKLTDLKELTKLLRGQNADILVCVSQVES